MNRLRELRKKTGLSLRALSEQVGLDYSTLAYCERGDNNFSAKSQKILAERFGVSIDYLLGKSAEEMFNEFADSMKDFMSEKEWSDGDITQSLSKEVAEPVRTKILILLSLREIDDLSRLKVIYDTATLQSAKNDFSTPIEED